LSPEVHVDPSTPADDPAFDGHTWLHRHVLRRFGNPWFLGKITRATPPNDEDGWSFHVIYTDGDEEDLSRNKVAADIAATRPTGATGLVGTPGWYYFKKIYDGIREHLQNGTFDHRSIPCMRTAFSFQSHTTIALDKVKLKLRACQRKLNPDKVSQQPARVKLLA
jgi:hypothetical protein